VPQVLDVLPDFCSGLQTLPGQCSSWPVREGTASNQAGGTASSLCMRQNRRLGRESDIPLRTAAAGAAAKPKAKDERGLVKILVEECLKSRAVWLFAISYFLCVPAISSTRHFLFPVGLLSPFVIVAWRLRASAELISPALAVCTPTYAPSLDDCALHL